VNFITDNLYLIGIAIVSGGALLFPSLMRRGAVVSPLQATQYINKGKTLILDVRTTDEFATGHLQNAKHIPLQELGPRTKEIEKSKSHVVIVVCASGARSGRATGLLNKAGFEQVFSLDGGIAVWKAAGLPIVK
jgi:rhodanese-related sulfurtransferase